MGSYSHYTVADLTSIRDRLMTALHARLTGPSAAASNGRSVQYGQGGPTEIRKELDAVNAELARRNGQATRGPIYMV